MSYTSWRVTPGRTQDFLKPVGRGKSIHESLGAQAILASFGNAGSATGVYGYGLLFPDLPAWGAFSDALIKNPDWLQLVNQHVDTPSPAATVVSQQVFVDQPGFETTRPEPGTFVVSYAFQQTASARAADVLSLSAENRDLWLKHGALAVSFQRAFIGGELTLNYSLVIAFPSAEAYANCWQSYSADSKTQDLLERTFGPGSPLMGLRAATGRVLAI